jgi:hypothetical protein
MLRPYGHLSPSFNNSNLNRRICTSDLYSRIVSLFLNAGEGTQMSEAIRSDATPMREG